VNLAAEYEIGTTLHHQGIATILFFNSGSFNCESGIDSEEEDENGEQKGTWGLAHCRITSQQI
jgi:hypothetical protein